MPRHRHRAPRAPHGAPWYARLRIFCLGYGCLDDQGDQPSPHFVWYVPLGQFQRAARTGDLSTVENFITSLGYNVNERDKRRRTALHYASVFNHPDIVMLLLVSNGNINAQDDDGCTPLMRAIEHNNQKCVSILMKRGADPHIKDFSGNTALHYAVYNGNRKIVNMLLEHGVNINAKSELGFTPFCLKDSTKRQQMAEFLKDREASPGEESKSVLKTSAHINAEVNDSTEHMSLTSKGTSAKEPKQRNKKHARCKKELHHSTDQRPSYSEVTPPGQLQSVLKKPVEISTANEGSTQKTSISEAIPLKQMKSINKTSESVDISEEVDNNMEQKSLSRLSDKPDPDIPGTTIEDNDRTSVTKTVTQDQEKTKCDSDYKTVHIQPPFEDSTAEKWAQVVGIQYGFINQYLKERSKKMMKEGIESHASDEEPPLPSTSGGRTHSMKMSSKQEYTSTQSEHLSAKKSEEELWMQMSANQYAFLNKILRKDFKLKVHKMYEESESNICSNGVPIPKKSKGKTHLKQKVTEEEEKHDIKDAHAHSRLPSVRRKEEVKEQADGHHTQLKDIQETLKEQLASEHARMRKLIRKNLEEIWGQFKNELRQMCMERVALVQEKVKKTQQEHWDLQYLQLKELFRRDIKEMIREEMKNYRIVNYPKEEPLPDASKETADFQRPSQKQGKKKKYAGDQDSAPSHSERPSVQAEEEITDGQSDSHCMPLKELIKEDLKEALCETLEKYKCDTCMKEEPPHILKGRKQPRKTSTEQNLRKKHDSKSLYSEQPATKTVKETEHEHRELQDMHLKEVITKDLEVKICDVLRKYENNACPKEEGLPRVSNGKTRLKKITQEQEMEKNNVECASSRSRPSLKRDEVTIGQQSALQHKHLKNDSRENKMEMVGEELEKSELTIHPKEEPPPDDSRRAKSTKVKEKKPRCLYEPHFNSFEHRIATLPATAHVEPAPAACPGDAGDMGDMDKAFKAELAFPVALAVCAEHRRWQPDTDPELAPGHCTGNTVAPPHHADLALDKLSTDPESAPLCGPRGTEDPAKNADLAFHIVRPTDHFRQSVNTNNRRAPAQGRSNIPDRLRWSRHRCVGSQGSMERRLRGTLRMNLAFHGCRGVQPD